MYDLLFQDPNPIAVATPKIDTALELFRMRDVTSPETTPLPSSEIDTSAVEGLNLSASLPLQQQVCRQSLTNLWLVTSCKPI